MRVVDRDRRAEPLANAVEPNGDGGLLDRGRPETTKPPPLSARAS
jgi:hypothetical protein